MVWLSEGFNTRKYISQWIFPPFRYQKEIQYLEKNIKEQMEAEDNDFFPVKFEYYWIPGA